MFEISHPQSSPSDTPYRMFFERMFMGVAFCKMIYEGDEPVDFLYIQVNKAFEELTRFRDVAGRKVSEVMPGFRELHPELISVYGRVARSGNPERLERYLPDMNAWFKITAYSTEPGFFTAAYEDIKEQKRAEQEIRNREVQFSNALAMTGAGAWEYDVASDTFFFDDNFYRVFGTSAGEVGGYTMSSAEYARRFCHPDDAPLVGAEVAAAIATKDPDFSRYIEHRVILKDGSTGHIAVRFIAVKDREGKTVKIFGVNQNITERKRQEDELRKREMQLINALAMAQACHWEYDLKTDLFTFNDNFYSIFRTTAENQGGYTMSSQEYRRRFLAPDAGPFDPRAINELPESRDPYFERRAEHPVIFGDGQRGYIAVRVYVQRDKDGRIVRTYGVNQDITERKKKEEEKKKLGTQLLNALNMAEAGHWEYDPGANLFTFNDSFYRVLHTTAEEQGGYTMSPAEYSKKFLPPDCPAIDPMQINSEEEAFDANCTRQIEHPVIFADGQPGYMAVRIYVIKDKDGRPIRACGVNQNITERKKKEEERKQLETQLVNALALAEACHWEYDFKTDLFIFNDNFYRIFHTTAKEQGGYTMPPNVYFQRFCPPGVAVEPGKINEHPQAKDPDFEPHFEHPVIFGDGQPGFITTRVRVERNKDGIITRLYGVNQDVTERRKREEERRKLEEQVQKGARLESLGLLAGGIAHDFNNLLSGIFGYLEMAKEHAGQERCMEYIGKALKAFARAKDLTLQLLTFSKGGAPCMKTGSLAPLLTETTRFAMSGSAISPEFIIADDLRQCDFDENQIAQVIDNIVINAVQAMPTDGSFFITADNVQMGKNENPALAEGCYVRLSFRDTGVGIPANLLSKIFDPFFTTKQKGNGLGLAIAYSIVKKHRGDIVAESEPGRGTIFNLYLPATQQSSGISGIAQSASHHGFGRILVMDDEQFIREIVADMLGSMGYETKGVCNGIEALDTLRKACEEKKPFRAAIMDLTIPGSMGGKEAIKKIRENDQELVVFVSSGYSDDPVMADPAEYGFTDKLQKPFLKMELAKVLEKYLAKS